MYVDNIISVSYFILNGKEYELDFKKIKTLVDSNLTVSYLKKCLFPNAILFNSHYSMTKPIYVIKNVNHDNITYEYMDISGDVVESKNINIHQFTKFLRISNFGHEWFIYDYKNQLRINKLKNIIDYE